MSLEDGDGYVPAHRLMKKLTSWSQATAKRIPITLTVNAVVESAFMKLARREAEDRDSSTASDSPSTNSEPAAEAVEAPPAAIGQRPSGEKGVRNILRQSNAECRIPVRSLLARKSLGRPSRCCPGHRACLGCPAASLHNSQEVEDRDSSPAGEAVEEPDALNMFYGIECIDGSINALPVEEDPEFIETEMTLDTGATVHAADRADLPAHQVLASAGSKAGQQFG